MDRKVKTYADTPRVVRVKYSRELQPEDPEIADTLGWIYYKKNVFLIAISLLKESAEKLPEDPMVRFHLGMAYYKKGEHEPARTELEKSLKLAANHSGAEEARTVLQEME